MSRHELLSTSTTNLGLASAPQAAFEVTTLADVVDATDGVLSLREAITEANATAGADRIGFADTLRGGTILLELDSLTITDDVVIDGDPADGGAAGIIIDGGWNITNVYGSIAYGFTGFVVNGAAARFEDLTVQNSGGAGIEAAAATVDVERSVITGSVSYGGAYGIRGDGSLTVRHSAITDNSSEAGTGIGFIGDVLVEHSTIAGQSGDYVRGMSVIGSARVIDSSISNNVGGVRADGVFVDGSLSIERSALIGNGQVQGFYATAIQVNGDLALSNSTIADTAVGILYAGRGSDMAAIGVGPDSTAVIVNSTLTGSRYAFGDTIRFPDVGTGIYVTPGSTATIANSIIDDSIVGSITSNGANTFRDTAVDGASSTDRLGIRAEQLFVETTVLRGTDITAGVAADNGGPTPTVALVNDPSNPALDAADPADAPATDQRGVLRDATPDIGAFEAEAAPAPVELVVTTLDDVVDSSDGVLSLREAISLANARPGENDIGFAPALMGGDILLERGTLVIVDDLVLDGADVTISQTANAPVMDMLQSTVRVSDLTVAGNFRSPLLDMSESDVHLTGVTVRDGGGYGIASENSSLTVTDSVVEGNAGNGIHANSSGLEIRSTTITGNGANFQGGIELQGGSLRLIDSVVDDNLEGGIAMFGDVEGEILDSRIIGNGGGIFLSGQLEIARSTIADNGLREIGNSPNGGISVSGGDLKITDSTIAGNRDDSGAAGIDIGSSNQDTVFEIVNTTIVDNVVAPFSVFPSNFQGGTGGVAIGANAEGVFINTTITGNSGREPPPGILFPAPAVGGLYVVAGASVTIDNVIATGNELDGKAADVTGTFSSGGANLFGQPVVPSAIGSDATGVDSGAVFALTRSLPGGTLAGVLADNGGPTLTVALLDDAANPAVDAGDPAAAPATDQRGFLRDALPDIGAFELGAEPAPDVPPLPPLAEKVPLADADILGAPCELFLLGPAADAEIAFVDEYAAFQNSLGVYLIGPEGEILGTAWAFAQVEHEAASDLASTAARPGGGPLSPGDAVQLSDLFDPAELSPGTEFGLFLVADGWKLNPEAVFAGGTLAFRTGCGTATITDATPALVHIAADGRETLVRGDILHSVDAGSPNPLSNTLNPGGTGQVTSGLLDGRFTVAFEDKPLANASDRDFNDALFAVESFAQPPAADLATLLAEPAPA